MDMLTDAVVVTDILLHRAERGWETDESAVTIWAELIRDIHGDEWERKWYRSNRWAFLPLARKDRDGDGTWSAWITPSGRVWSVPYGEHSRFVEQFHPHAHYHEFTAAGFIHFSGNRFDYYWTTTHSQRAVMDFLKARWNQLYKDTYAGPPYDNKRDPIDDRVTRLAQDQWPDVLRRLNAMPSEDNRPRRVAKQHQETVNAA